MPTADSGETASGNPAGETTPPTGSIGGDTGNQTPSPKSGLTVEDLKSTLSETLGPLQERLNALEGKGAGSHPAARRIASRRFDGTESETDGDNSSDDPKTAELLREVQGLKAAEEKRVASEKKGWIAAALKAELDTKKVANRDILEGLLNGKLREGESGAILYDDGTKAVPLADAVKTFAERDIFKPASSGGGTGITSGERLPSSGKSSATTAEAITKMTPQERNKMAARINAGERPGF